ncbi:Protein AIM2 [Psilocybe cubensis]|uniref:Protein AIM2 n=1 Tax=Psilocybe cubensis TaxID=181762 RepID=A0ACB8GX96_PSICU|nr:Protein AIM2 [Psilocybe cubensis]KAH9480067.1 Protein AIM2 [Psilocybe cubensis]
MVTPANQPTQFIHLLKEKKGYEKIGTVGYCFGGATCVRIGGSGLVDSVVVAHPGPFSISQVRAIKVPTAWVCAEDDMTFSKSFRSECEAHLAGRKGKENFVEYEFKEYKGTTHGFASRPNLAIPEIREAHQAALDQTIEWFKKTLI